MLIAFKMLDFIWYYHTNNINSTNIILVFFSCDVIFSLIYDSNKANNPKKNSTIWHLFRFSYDRLMIAHKHIFFCCCWKVSPFFLAAWWVNVHRLLFLKFRSGWNINRKKQQHSNTHKMKEGWWKIPFYRTRNRFLAHIITFANCYRLGIYFYFRHFITFLLPSTALSISFHICIWTACCTVVALC